MSECNGNCGECKKDCEDRDMSLKQNDKSNIKKVFAVVSGKGGVGKSSVTCALASAMRARKKEVAVLDADITGPSVPKMFGISGMANATEENLLLPRMSKTGIKVMSVNLLLEQENTPVVWRGPVISGVISQFFTDVCWGDVDFMFVDMPPGTGDAALTVFQSLNVDGIIVVLTPGDLVEMIVEKAVNMAKMMNIPILGMIENMSFFTCPDCGKNHFIFGESKAAEVAAKNGIKLLAQLPIDPKTAKYANKGEIELSNLGPFDALCDELLKV